jgi:ubiquinone/menaquinone biosynthesis C-methylase UbiE
MNLNNKRHTEDANLTQQYATDKNLAARTNLHEKCSTNKQGFVPWLFEQYQFAENYIILELGCGNAVQWAKRAGNLPKGSTLILSDFSPGMLKAAKENMHGCKNAEFAQIDIQNIPFGNEQFDAVIANHMLYHVPDIDKAIAEVWRVLKPGGTFYAATNGNGGMQTFLHAAFKSQDPNTTAFSYGFSFNLQNGEEILKRQFKNTTRKDYEDSLKIDQTDDLLEWLYSSVSLSTYSKEDAENLRPYFENLKAKTGFIEIPKEVGLFICKKGG